MKGRESGSKEAPIVYLFLFLLGTLIAYLVLSLLAGRPLFSFGLPGRKIRRGPGKAGKVETIGGEREKIKTCPICGTRLRRGERVKSVVFAGGVRAGTVTERMSHLFGCPYCYPATAATPRICPVCRKVLPDDGYLIARMFENTERPRKHVHVLGCTVCREGRRK